MTEKWKQIDWKETWDEFKRDPKRMAEEIARLREELKKRIDECTELSNETVRLRSSFDFHTERLVEVGLRLSESRAELNEEIARLRADFKFIEECSGKEYALLQKSRAANARLRRALEFMTEATCTLHDHPEGQKRCREALATTDGKQELEAVKSGYNSDEPMKSCDSLLDHGIAINRTSFVRGWIEGFGFKNKQLRDAFGLGE